MNSEIPFGQNQNPQFNQFNVPQVTPNSTAVLVLGILSIVFCWCYGLLAVILGIVALVLASQGDKAYKVNPQFYTTSSYSNLKAGRVCAIIGLSLGALMIIFVILAVIIQGVAAFSLFNSLNY
jgi:hypothetical protein